jgi:hypothetical protein
MLAEGRRPYRQSLLDGQASVDADDLTGDVVALRTQEANHACDLLGFPEAVQGNAVDDLLADLIRSSITICRFLVLQTWYSPRVASTLSGRA